MNADSAFNVQTVLLVLEKEQAIIPVSTNAFTAAQSSRKELARYVGGLVLYRDGDVRRIEEIQVLGLFGNGLFRKALSALTSAWRISVRLSSPIGMSLDAVRQLVSKYAVRDRELEDPYLPDSKPLEVVEAAIRSSQSVAEIFGALEVPSPENSLDAL